jgi:hypothetical protein
LNWGSARNCWLFYPRDFQLVGKDGSTPEACPLSLVDLLISIGSAGLAVFSLPTVLNKNSQVPRKTASIPSAAILTYFVPLFAISGLDLTAITIAGQAIVWWLIVAFRPVRNA